MGRLYHWHFKVRRILTVTLISIVVFGLPVMASEEVVLDRLGMETLINGIDLAIHYS